MKFSEIAERVKDGTITFDTRGHQFPSWFKDHFIERYEHNLAGANGSGDGTWQKRDEQTIEEVNQGMREFYQRILDYEAEEGEYCWLLSDGEKCQGCGDQLRWMLDGNVLTPRHFYNHEKRSNEIHPLEYRCPWEHPKPTKGEIKVASTLVFANFFEQIEDSPDGEKYSKKYDLCSMLGLENITKHKADHNVAFGQMSNMGIGIYVNGTKDSIIVGPCYHPAENQEFESDEEFEKAIAKPLFDGYELVKTLSCEVWRWEATDAVTIDGFMGPNWENQLFERFKYNKPVKLDVKHGVWQFEHYFGCLTDDSENRHCYSKFTLVSNKKLGEGKLC